MAHFEDQARGLKWASLTAPGVGAMIWTLVLGLPLIFAQPVMPSTLLHAQHCAARGVSQPPASLSHCLQRHSLA